MPITVFSRSVTGYNRQQVDEYIANMNRAFAKSKQDYEKKIEILEAEIIKLNREIREDIRHNAGPPVSEITTNPEYQTTPDSVTEKSRRYDEISHQIGEILMNANAEASVIVREADEKVKTALASTMSTLRCELTSLSMKLGELLESAETALAVEKTDGEDS